jgi:hypothetical protein
MQGWLYKKSPTRILNSATWQKRYFILSSVGISYYKGLPSMAQNEGDDSDDSDGNGKHLNIFTHAQSENEVSVPIGIIKLEFIRRVESLMDHYASTPLDYTLFSSSKSSVLSPSKAWNKVTNVLRSSNKQKSVQQQNRFNIELVGGRVFELYCDCILESNDWITALQHIINSRSEATNEYIQQLKDECMQDEYWKILS